MSVIPSHLRPGNWIHCKGSSHYGIVTGEILAKMERDEKFREKFEYIELTHELLNAAGMEYASEIYAFISHDIPYLLGPSKDGFFIHKMDEWTTIFKPFKYLHEWQNFHFSVTGTELPLPESAKLIPVVVE